MRNYTAEGYPCGARKAAARIKQSRYRDNRGLMIEGTVRRKLSNLRIDRSAIFFTGVVVERKRLILDLECRNDRGPEDSCSRSVSMLFASVMSSVERGKHAFEAWPEWQ